MSGRSWKLIGFALFCFGATGIAFGTAYIFILLFRWSDSFTFLAFGLALFGLMRVGMGLVSREEDKEFLKTMDEIREEWERRKPKE